MALRLELGEVIEHGGKSKLKGESLVCRFRMKLQKKVVWSKTSSVLHTKKYSETIAWVNEVYTDIALTHATTLDFEAELCRASAVTFVLDQALLRLEFTTVGADRARIVVPLEGKTADIILYLSYPPLPAPPPPPTPAPAQVMFVPVAPYAVGPAPPASAPYYQGPPPTPQGAPAQGMYPQTSAPAQGMYPQAVAPAQLAYPSAPQPSGTGSSSPYGTMHASHYPDMQSGLSQMSIHSQSGQIMFKIFQASNINECCAQAAAWMSSISHSHTIVNVCSYVDGLTKETVVWYKSQY